MILDFASSTNASLPAIIFILSLNQMAFYPIPISLSLQDEKEMPSFLKKMKELSSRKILWKNTHSYTIENFHLKGHKNASKYDFNIWNRAVKASYLLNPKPTTGSLQSLFKLFFSSYIFPFLNFQMLFW